MLSGRLQGQLMRWISLLLRPKRILEVGTFTGYGSLCLAEGLPPEGTLDTIEGNRELEYLIRKYIEQGQLEDRVCLHLGDALEIIPDLEGLFDLIYLDANKRDYRAYYDLCLPKLQNGGILLADNVLWGGKVIQPHPDIDTQLMQAFNDQVLADERVECLMLPIRDGLMMVRKIC